MKRFSLLACLFTLCLLAFPGDGNAAKTRNCVIEVKAEADGIQRFKLSNGSITGTGKVWGSARNCKHCARHRAADGVSACLKDAIKRTSKPRNCTSRKQPASSGSKWISKYELSGDLKKQLFREICQKAYAANKSGTIKGIRISSWRTHGGKSCKHNNWDVAKGLSTTCDKGSEGKEQKDYQNKWSGWHNKSSSGLKSHIKKYCKSKFNMSNYTIHSWHVDKGGKLKVKYSCR